MVRMADVAKAAGVSSSAVSHVLNGTRSLSPRTEARVRKAMRELGYVPDPYARSLRKRSSGIVAVAMSAISNPFFAPVVRELEVDLAGIGRSILLADTHDDPEVEARIVRELIALRPSALILAPSGPVDYVLRSCSESGIPVVFIDRITDMQVADQVGVENVRPVDLLTTHLMELGHKEIGLLCSSRGLTTTTERRDGFELAHARAGLPVLQHHIQYGDGTEVGADRAAEALLAGSDRPTAVVSANNVMTMGLLRVASRLELEVPDNVALCCYDDFDWAPLFRPGLTAVAQPIAALAANAARLLGARIQQPDRPPETLVLRPQMNHRTSCGCPPGAAAPWPKP